MVWNVHSHCKIYSLLNITDYKGDISNFDFIPKYLISLQTHFLVDLQISILKINQAVNSLFQKLNLGS
jgi:hypothetical protein